MILLAAPALYTLAVGILNLLTWPASAPPVRMPTSALIPARNEAKNIVHAVNAALAAGVDEVIVCDDGSVDDTAALVAAIPDSRVRLIHAAALPPGWIGKAHACAALSSEARHERLLFVDADVRLAPDSAHLLNGLAAAWRADVVTAFPRQITETWAERALMPLLALTYAAWLPQVLVPLTHDPRFLAANGQVLLIDRAVLDVLGGFAAIRGELVDDMALCRLVKARGHRVLFADGRDLAACRMYESHAEIWAGFLKNLYEGLGSPLALIGACGAVGSAFLLPWVLLLLTPAFPALWEPAAVGVAANLTLRGLLALRYGHHPASIAAHPFAVAWLLALAAASWRATRRGAQQWRGRSYAAPEARVGP
jgi:chlorobactene glucosyltransferase